MSTGHLKKTFRNWNAETFEHLKKMKEILVTSWWLNQPIWKICSSKWVHLPQVGMNIKNIWNHHLEYSIPVSPPKKGSDGSQVGQGCSSCFCIIFFIFSFWLKNINKKHQKTPSNEFLFIHILAQGRVNKLCNRWLIACIKRVIRICMCWPATA